MRIKIKNLCFSLYLKLRNEITNYFPLHSLPTVFVTNMKLKTNVCMSGGTSKFANAALCKSKYLICKSIVLDFS